MRRRLPARPNPEHLRTQAKALLAKVREGDAEAARTLAEYLPEAATLSPEEVREHGFRLADAQAAIARKSGFAAWPGLARHVDRLRSMEGTWGFRSLEVDGAAVPGSMLTNSSLLIDGDRFRLCLGLVGSRRPESFATSPGSGHALEELIRKHRERPPAVAGGTPPAEVV